MVQKLDYSNRDFGDLSVFKLIIFISESRGFCLNRTLRSIVTWRSWMDLSFVFIVLGNTKGRSVYTSQRS